MNKSELIESVSADADISKAAAERALNSVIEAVTKAVTRRPRDAGWFRNLLLHEACGTDGQKPPHRREDQDRCSHRAQVLRRRCIQGRGQQEKGEVIQKAK